MERPQFVNEEIYHIFNRGVEKRRIFLNAKDHLRFIHNLYEFNNENPALNAGRLFQDTKRTQENDRGTSRKLLVEILCFCLMPNHYHILVKQRVDNGITEFMRKLGTGYTNYFNIKYQRVGPLLQGKFKAVHIKKENQLLYLPHYIHLNPLDIFMPEWRDGKIKSHTVALRHLDSYRWSSYWDYVGKKNFPSVIQNDFIRQMYDCAVPHDYQKRMQEWLRDFNFVDLYGVTFDSD